MSQLPIGTRDRPLSRRRGTPEILTTMLVGGASPYLLYALVRPHLSEVRAILVAALFPAVVEIASLAGHRRLAPLSSLNLIALGAGLLVAAHWGGPQVTLVRGSVITGAVGVVLLLSLLLRRPATFYVARQAVAGNSTDRSRSFDSTWDAVPRLRHLLRLTALVWAIAYLTELCGRLVMVRLLSRERALVFGPIIFWSVQALLLVWTAAYLGRTWPRAAAPEAGAGPSSR